MQVLSGKYEILLNFRENVSKNWMKEKRHDYYYRKAKQTGYRSRASYKLIQIDRKFHIFRKGDLVVELGAAPGGWSQVALELIGEEGRLVGVDLQGIRPLEGAIFIKGDFTDDAVKERIREELGGRNPSVVISDMSPNISGAYSTDHARSVYLTELALDFAIENLKKGGVFVAKVFEGDLLPPLLKKARANFGMVKMHSPPASRSSSSEIYIVAKGFRGRPENRERSPEPVNEGT